MLPPYHSRPDERADQVRNDGPWWLCCLVSPSDPVSGTGTGFDSSPIKGEGESGWFVLLYASPCGYCLEASMTGTVCSGLVCADGVGFYPVKVDVFA